MVKLGEFWREQLEQSVQEANRLVYRALIDSIWGNYRAAARRQARAQKLMNDAVDSVIFWKKTGFFS
jgi:hypothetical protein